MSTDPMPEPALAAEVRRLRDELADADAELVRVRASLDSSYRRLDMLTADRDRQVAAAVLRGIPRLCDDCRINVNDRAEQYAGDVEVPDGDSETAVAIAIGEDGIAYLEDDTELPPGTWEPAGDGGAR